MTGLKKHRKSRKLLKITAALGPFFVFLAGVFYTVFFTSILRIDKAVVLGADEFRSGAGEIAKQKLAQKIFNKIPINNYLFLPQKEISGAILDKFPEIKAVVGKKSLGEHSLSLNLEPRRPAVIWCRVLTLDTAAVLNLPPAAPDTVASSTDGTQVSPESPGLPEAENCFFADSDGFIFKAAPVLSGGVIPIVYERTERDLKIKDTVFDERALQFILETKKQLDAVNLGLTDFVISGQTLGDLEILSPDGWKIILSLDQSPAVQVNALKRVLEEEIEEKRSQLEYVDLRVENRVYYKLR